MSLAKKKQLECLVLPSDFLSYREFLQQLYLSIKAKLGRYSYQKFAEDLGFPATGIIHQITKGRRKLSAKSAARVIEALDLRGLQRLYLLKLVEHNNASTPQAREAHLQELLDLKTKIAPTAFDKEKLAFFGEWWHAVIRELVALPNFSPDPEWIARRLEPRIRPEQARKSLELLIRLGLVRFDQERGVYMQEEGALATPRETNDLGVVSFQQTMIALGQDSITTVNEELRSVSAISIRVSREMISSLKEKIHDFHMELLAGEASPDDADAVYQMNIQLFPLTKVENAEEKSDDDAA